ncbi:MAG: hypothetical protein A3J74_04570 [Elusimicrobia bacterium RIFCSPHIGHO2_02_FULL_57_9]|nr:MAG: hypothetical protein A3J74_04570 [Elusimicrobia bacterium RIFCSPHIGHO2_02_FULL_57_9]
MKKFFFPAAIFFLALAFTGCDSCGNSGDGSGAAISSGAAPPAAAVRQNLINCPAGQHLGLNGKCVDNMNSCPAASRLDAGGNCVLDPQNPNPCPAGTHLDDNTCVPDAQ